MGNFFVDVWRVVMYTFLPVSFALALIFLLGSIGNDQGKLTQGHQLLGLGLDAFFFRSFIGGITEKAFS
jgi:K+-transporting ATPase A subunit